MWECSVFHSHKKTMAHAPNELTTGLLKQVSRSFYLTLRVLPKCIRPQIGLAYLIARTTDTIADTEIVPLEQRLLSLRKLRERILRNGGEPLDFTELAKNQGAPAERFLLERCEASVSLLNTFSAADQQLIREVLVIITSGQELDLRRFAGASASRIVSLQTEDELDDYTYRVAGCVGEFWTKMCRANVFPKAALDDSFLLRNGVRFGKGLQLVNILRDLPTDLRNGRCYLPREALRAVNLGAEDLLNPANEPKLRPGYDEWLNRAESHLVAGWAYTNALPWRAARVRLACAWPILIGFKTLDRLRPGNVLDPRRRIKVPRGEVYRQVILPTLALYPWPGRWHKLGIRQSVNR